MVLQRTIDNLRDRPTHEREAVAFWIAIAVVGILLLAWGVYFFRSVGAPDLKPVNDAYSQAVQQVQTQAPYDATGWVSSANQPASAGSAVGAASMPENTTGQIQIVQQDDASTAYPPAPDYSSVADPGSVYDTPVQQ